MGCLRAAIWMKREARFLQEVLPGVPWWEGPPGMGIARPFDFKKNFDRMIVAARKYLEDAGAKNDIGHIMTLPLRSIESKDDGFPQLTAPPVAGRYPTDGLTGFHAEDWIRSIVDFFRLGLEKQMRGKNPRVEVT